MSEPTPDVPVLLTERLRLRRLTVADAAGLHECFGDPEAMRFWDAPASPDLAETERRIRQSVSIDPTWHAAWAVLARPHDGFLGMVNYHERRPWNRRLVVGWILARRHWGAGLMHEAMAALLAHCFGALETQRIEAEIEPDNHRSLRLAERLGFAREGLLRDRLCVAGEPRSILMHALLRPDWRAADGRRLACG